MFLILEQRQSRFGRYLQEAMTIAGIDCLSLTPEEIICQLGISLHIDDNGSSVRLAVGPLSFLGDELAGVYSAIDFFPETLWEFFSKEDAAYASMEWQALWHTFLTALPCPVINPPALDALAGAFLSDIELFAKAGKAGLAVPEILEVESGTAASVLAEDGAYLSYRDRGNCDYQEYPLNKDALLRSPTCDHQISIKERLPGKKASILLVGATVFTACLSISNKKAAAPYADIPERIIEMTKKLHVDLHLLVAEYFFTVTADKQWIFTGYRRSPSDRMLLLHKPAVLATIVAIVKQKKKS